MIHVYCLKKLCTYGIVGHNLNLLESYLQGWSMYLINGKVTSKVYATPNYGVPQGSVLGPLLFNLYVNDLCTSLNHSNHILFADDTILYITGKDITSVYIPMNKDIKISQHGLKQIV